MTPQFCRLFWHISYCKVQQSNFITKYDRLLLQNASGITKYDWRYYKVRQVLQSVTVVTEWDVTQGTKFKVSFFLIWIFIYMLKMKLAHQFSLRILSLNWLFWLWVNSGMLESIQRKIMDHKSIEFPTLGPF